MSYGVVASKIGSVRVEGLPAPADDPADETAAVSSPWAAGRITLTSLHLTFVPTHGSSGVGPLTVALADIVSADASSGHLHRVATFRTATVAVHARVPGAAAFAERVSLSVEGARKRRQRPSSRPDPAQSYETPDRTITP